MSLLRQRSLHADTTATASEDDDDPFPPPPPPDDEFRHYATMHVAPRNRHEGIMEEKPRISHTLPRDYRDYREPFPVNPRGAQQHQTLKVSVYYSVYFW